MKLHTNSKYVNVYKDLMIYLVFQIMYSNISFILIFLQKKINIYEQLNRLCFGRRSEETADVNYTHNRDSNYMIRHEKSIFG